MPTRIAPPRSDAGRCFPVRTHLPSVPAGSPAFRPARDEGASSPSTVNEESAARHRSWPRELNLWPAPERHRVDGRLSKWLLMCADRAQSQELALTHEFIATMLGARRAGVAEAACLLKNAGLISYKRGKVT